jgi:tricorn protease-like protein
MPRLLSWFNENLVDKKYYTIEFYWKGSADGHIMLTFKKNGKLFLYDPQSNEIFSDKDLELKLYLVRRSSIKLLNISDCFLNKSVVESVLEARK